MAVFQNVDSGGGAVLYRSAHKGVLVINHQGCSLPQGRGSDTARQMGKGLGFTRAQKSCVRAWCSISYILKVQPKLSDQGTPVVDKICQIHMRN